jgi:hypothetical protein
MNEGGKITENSASLVTMRRRRRRKRRGRRKKEDRDINGKHTYNPLW